MVRGGPREVHRSPVRAVTRREAGGRSRGVAPHPLGRLGPGAAPRGVGVLPGVVPGPDPHLVLGPAGQVVHRVGRNGGVGVAAVGGVGVPVRGIALAGGRPDDAVVGGRGRGRVPPDGERAGGVAGQGQAGHRAVGSRLGRGFGSWCGGGICRTCHGDGRLVGPGAAPGAALVLPGVVPGAHHHLELGPGGQVVHRVGVGGGVGVAPVGGVVVPVRGEVLAGGRPGHPVVGGRLAGLIPGDDQLARGRAGELQVLDLAPDGVGGDGAVVEQGQ